MKYTSGQSTFNADYSYDEAARLTNIDEDWMDGDGLWYAYDEAGRLETITDYDDTVLTYAYDGNGNVTQMTDYHSNVTTYGYDDANRLSSITAPGSKTWGN